MIVLNELAQLMVYRMILGVTYCILLLIRILAKPAPVVLIDEVLSQVEILLIIQCKKDAAILQNA